MGNNLRAARKVAGLSQEQLAERAGVPQSNISRFETGKVPFVDDAIRLARALSTTVESLFPEGFDPNEAADEADLSATGTGN